MSGINKKNCFRRLTSFGLIPVFLLLNMTSASSFQEHAVKSAFLYRLPSFITWDGESAGGHFNLCAYMPNPNLDIYSNLHGRTIRNSRIRFIRKNESDSLTGCKLVFVGEQAERMHPDFRQLLPEKNVLAVGETRNFVKKGGGAISLIRRGERVQIEINLQAVERAGLSVDSDLLELATIINPAS